MKVEQLYTGCLAEAAYYIESDGEATIIDPLRETKPYLEKIEENGVELKYIFETHFHADFVSGHIDLAKETGASIVYGPEAKTNYEIIEAEDGQTFKLGQVTIEVLHTPGHTPESTTYLLRDKDDKPYCIFSGDTLFIGDVGRPDLAVKGNDLTEKDLAGMLYDSLQNKILPLPDDVLVYPAHGAGSACGKNMSSETFSTLGEQRKSNYALQAKSKEDFIEQVTEGIAPPPQYFPKAARLNKEGYGSISEVLEKGLHALSVDEAKEAMNRGALLLDVRDKDAFRQGHIPNSIFIGLDGSFASWVGTLIQDMSTPIIVIAPEGREEESVTRLARVGYDNAIGYLEGGIDAWKKAGNDLKRVRSVDAQELKDRYGSANIVDVRKPGEYEAEHVENATSFPLDYINDHLNDLSRDEDQFLHCKSGYRSMIAISLLEKAGYENLVDVKGGFDALLDSDIPKTAFVCPSER